MKEYLLLFWNESGNGQYAVSPEEMQAAMHDWQGWIGNIAMQGKLVATKPINYEGRLVTNDRQLDGPAVQDGQLVTGFLICKSENIAEVESWSQTCPILKAPKGFVEIRECSPFNI